VGAAASEATAGSPRSLSRGELRRLLEAWPGSAPTALGADQAGPFWVRRSGEFVGMERLADGRILELSRVRAPAGHPPEAFRPRLVRGDGPPQMLYRSGGRLAVTGEPGLAGAMGEADWESYSAWRSGAGLFAAAFGIAETGKSSVALLPGGAEAPTVTALRPAPQGVWEPKALLSPTQAHVVYRGSLIHPRRGFGLIVETMDRSALASSEVWLPAVRRQYQLGASEPHYGEPSACLDQNGAVHWASAAWNGSQMTGAIHVDGVELTVRGRSGSVYWLPALACVAGHGLALAVPAPSGQAHVGLVRGEDLLTLAELPSVPPAYSQAPPLFVASSGPSLYIATGHGLWRHDAEPPAPVPAFPPVLVLSADGLLGGIGLARLRTRKRIQGCR
jgi:hypothetical protein